jgi:hypothetical protein
MALSACIEESVFEDVTRNSVFWQTAGWVCNNPNNNAKRIIFMMSFLVSTRNNGARSLENKVVAIRSHIGEVLMNIKLKF